MGKGTLLYGRMWNGTNTTVFGKPAINQGPANRNNGEALTFMFGTDSAVSNNGFSSPDITSSLAAGTRTTLLPASQVPLNMRPYITRLDLAVDGSFDWVGATSITIEDTFGNLLAYFPLTSLRHGACYTFPSSDQDFPLLVGPGANCITSIVSVSPSGVITTTANPCFTNNLLVGTPVLVVDYAAAGTLPVSPVGQMMMVTGNTTNTITVGQNIAGGSSGFTTPIDPNATLAFPYWSLSAVADSTHLTLLPTGTTNFPSGNSLDNGYNVVGAVGTSAGTSRVIASNTTAGAVVLTVGTNTAFVAATSLIQITNEPNLFGAIDGCTSQKWRAAAVQGGIQAVVNGSPSVGSPIRIYGEGYFADYLSS